MEKMNYVLLVKQPNGELYAINYKNGEIRVQMNIEDGSIDCVSVYHSEDEIRQAISEYLKSFAPNEPIILRSEINEVRSVLHKGQYLSVHDFSPAWIAERCLDMHRYPTVNSTRESNNTEFHALDEEKINKDQLLLELGINIDSLRETGDLDKMLDYGRSRLLTAYPVIAGVCFPMQAKLSLRERSDGSLAVIPHPIRLKPNLDEYRGYKFTDEDRSNLLSMGNLGHTVVIDSRILGLSREVYLSLDCETNELVALAKGSIRIPPCITGVQLTDREHEILTNGGAIYLSGLTAADGHIFDAVVQVNAEKRCITFYKPTTNEAI